MNYSQHLVWYVECKQNRGIMLKLLLEPLENLAMLLVVFLDDSSWKHQEQKKIECEKIENSLVLKNIENNKI